MLVLDTDVLIDVQRGHTAAVQWFASLTELPSVPGFVVMELVQDARDSREMRSSLRLVAPLPVVWPTKSDCEKALADFTAFHLSHGLGLLDALIGACTVGLAADLCTFNVRHFTSSPVSSRSSRILANGTPLAPGMRIETPPMKAIQLEQPKQFRIIDVPEPSAPGPGDAVVRVHRVGICGTDYSGYLGKMPFFSYPRIPGHELGVEVVAIGSGVTNVKPGDRAAVEPYINCQNCYSCARGHTNACENHQTLGVHCDGGLRPLFTIPARKLHVSTKLSYEQFALVETLGIGLHAINRANPKPDETVLVIGAGPIGLSVIEFAKLAGSRVIAMDLNEQRLEFARTKMGVRETILAKSFDEDVKAFTDLTAGKLGNVVVDATGSAKSMSSAYHFVGFAGRLVWVGITQDPLSFTQPLMHRREMTFLASRNALAPEFTRIVRLIEGGMIDTRPWITHTAPFDGMLDAFPGWMKPEAGVVKAMVEIA